MEKGLFYTGSSITRIREQTTAELPTAKALQELEGRPWRWPSGGPARAAG